MSTFKSEIRLDYGDVFTSSSTQGQDLGAPATTGDGRYFRYVLAGSSTNLVVGNLQQSSAEVTAIEDLAVAASAIGANTVTTTSTVTVTANEYAGGLLIVSDNTGEGYTYKIASHPAATSAVVTFTLEDPIHIALDTTSTVTVVASPFANVIINPATASGTPVGVCVFPITKAQYGWLQVKGPTAVLANGAVTVGTTVVASNGVAGAVEPFAGVQQIVGTAINGIVDTEYGPVMFNLP